MTTRLDRLLLLLSTGSTPLVRQTAARQLGQVAGIRIARVTSTHNVSSIKQAQQAAFASSSSSGSSSAPTGATAAAAGDGPAQGVYRGLDGEWAEVVNLLVKLLPYLRNKSWETRSAAALAVECILRAVGIWSPHPDIQNMELSAGTSALPSTSPLDSFDLVKLLLEETKLLASSGNEYAKAEASGKGANGSGQGGKGDLVKAMGLSLPGAGDQDLGIDVEQELLDGQQQESSSLDKGKGKERAAATSEEPDLSKLSARERNALKRKRKAGSASLATTPADGRGASYSPAPPSHKKRIVDSPTPSASTSKSASPNPVAIPVKKEESDVGLMMEEDSTKVTISYRGPKGGAVDVAGEDEGDAAQGDQPSWMPPPEEWPFGVVALALQDDLLSASWEIRHGACLGLREIIKVQGCSAGMIAGESVSSNFSRLQVWYEDLTESLLKVFALDRFGDFVGDQVVAPVRETASQTLAAALVAMPQASVVRVLRILQDMISQEEVRKMQVEAGRKSYHWEVRHAGLLGLKYLVAVRRDLFVNRRKEDVKKEEDQQSDKIAIDRSTASQPSENLLKAVLGAALQGLSDSDDDVRGVAASAMIPIVDDLVTTLAPSDLMQLLDVIKVCLGDLRDDLSSSVGNVLDLLAAMIKHQTVLDFLSDGNQGHSLSTLIPRLYPFFRHTITNVRLSVVNTLNVFLSLSSAHVLPWCNEKVFRVIYQNMIVEERLDIRVASAAAWTSLLGHFAFSSMASSTTPATTAHQKLPNMLTPYLPGWLDVLMTPIGTPINTNFFWKPSDSASGASGVYNVDKPMLLQDLALVPPQQTIRCRLAASTALAALFSHWPLQFHDQDLGQLLPSYLTSASSHQMSFACIIIEEWARLSPSPLAQSSPLVGRLAALVVRALESDPAIVYSESSSLLSQIHTLCSQLFGILKNKGKVPSAKIPNLIAPDQGGFTLDRASQLVESDYPALLSLVKDKARLTVQPLLDELRGKIRDMVARTASLKDAQDVQVFSALAGTCISLKMLPSKMNPLVRSVMNGIKFESNLDLQSRSARSIATFLQLCSDPQNGIKSNPAEKIVKNICNFLCQDTTLTPLFATSKLIKQGIFSLSLLAPNVQISTIQDGKTPPKKVPTAQLADIAATEADADSKVRLVRRGAELSIAALTERLGSGVFDRLPKIWSCMSDSLLQIFVDDNVPRVNALLSSSPDSVGQDLLDCLTVLGSVAPALPPVLRAQVVQLLPKLVLAIQLDHAVVRHVAARNFAILSGTMIEDGMKAVVLDVIPFAADPLSVSRRRGAIELISHLVERLDIKILPYVIFLVVPVLGRMTDSDDEVRMLATSTFATLVKLVPLEAGLPDPPGFSAELLRKRSSERDFLTQLLDGSKVADYTLPIEVSVKLRKYQQEGVNWLAFLAKYQLHGILCDDMGLGKTLQSICILASKTHERAERYAMTQSPDAIHLPSLVVCPPTLTGHWQQEIATYVGNLRAVIYGGDRAERIRKTKSLREVDVVIMSYDVVRNDIDALSAIEWNYCILDEGHIIKNGKTKLSKAIKTIRANHRLILSGTPIQNNVLELWSLFDFLMPGFLGTEDSFNRRFGKPIQQSRDAKSSSREQEAGALALEALHKQVLPFLLRRLKEDVLDDLPPKIIQDYYCDLSPLQRDLYESHSRSRSDGDDLAANGAKPPTNGQDSHVFQALQYLRKLVNHPTLVLNDSEEHRRILVKHGLADKGARKLRDIEHAPKLLALKQLLIDNGIGVPSNNSGNVKAEAFEATDSAVAPHRVLIFCQQKGMLDIIEDEVFGVHLPSVTYMRMDGTTPTQKRHGVVTKFNSDPSIDVLLLTTHVGGLGLNLTGADTVIFVEHDWNPSKDLQAMDRAHRLGQKRTVNVYRLITRGTLEDKIMGLQRFKLNIASSVVTQDNAGLSTMDTENVLDLFSLGDTKSEGDVKQNNKGGPISQKALLEGLQELDDDGEEYRDLAQGAASFAQSLR